MKYVHRFFEIAWHHPNLYLGIYLGRHCPGDLDNGISDHTSHSTCCFKGDGQLTAVNFGIVNFTAMEMRRYGIKRSRL